MEFVLTPLYFYPKVVSSVLTLKQPLFLWLSGTNVDFINETLAFTECIGQGIIEISFRKTQLASHSEIVSLLMWNS